ncbi:MAG: hypothetical protein NZ651_05055 [Candidatus Bipolaricaulota bacterium]|nr:hypothetical protein [Candidatus Bipolaricaulota bacterium]MDW8127122.1 hypothetical protein [Candidatus Bipolaricaulota bacterium]
MTEAPEVHEGKQVPWEEVVKKVEEGEQTPAKVARAYGFKNWVEMEKSAPEEWKEELRKARLRGQKKRCKEGKTTPRKESPCEEVKVEEKPEPPHEKVAKVEVKKEEKDEVKPQEKKEKSWIMWAVVGVALLALVYMSWKAREREERARRFIERAFREERPEGGPRDFRSEYRI